MKITKRTVLSLCLFIGIISICLILITLLSGFRHEFKKFKHFILTLVAILLIRYTLLEHIVFFLQALFLTLRGQKDDAATSVQYIDQEVINNESNDMVFLKLRLNSLKSQLKLDERHRNESLNWKYKELLKDLWLFGKYFLLLLLVVVYTRNSYAYYNTAVTRRLLNDSYFSSYKMKKVLVISDLYYWINGTLTASLNEGYDYDGTRIEEPGWLNFRQSKLLGAVRLQQTRHAQREKSMSRINFDEQDYFPGWQQLNKSLPYIDKYWRIYYPWMAKQQEGIASWLMPHLRIGSLYSYSERQGYVALLARDQRNSEKILSFLKEQHWLDDRTAAVFIDFTLYNGDSNIFTICSILVEQTPFGNLLWQISVQSAELLWNNNEVSMRWWLLMVLYSFQMLEFCKVMISRSWFLSGFFKSRWNCVDFTIVILNILLVSVALLREVSVRHVMELFVLSQKLEYVDFRIACVFNYMTSVILGLLICLASVRLWKVLQFASIFRIFNRTLYTSGASLISTILGIHIFICAIGKSGQILNGSNSEIFSRYLKSITSILSFSFGFNSATSPDDLSHGSNVFGFFLYLILMFVVAIFLMNMFITLICDHFANAREERDREPANELSFLEFLIMEYSFIGEFFRRHFALRNKTKNQTVSENIYDQLDELERKLREKELMENSERKSADDHIFENESRRTDRIRNVAAVLNLQLQILNRLVDSEYEGSR